MKTVKQIAKISGVSVRTLHYYDEIGLFKPSAVTEAGYRLYDDEALSRLQSILFFRELGFSLGEIKRIVENPDFDRDTALKDRLAILTLQKEQLEKTISLVKKMIEKGEYTVNFSAFDKSKLNEYSEEVKKRWGESAEYRQSEKRTAARSEDENALIADGMMNIFAGFGKIKSCAPDSSEAAALVKKLQSYISENYYDCPDTVLACLGEMYTGDERFRKNIDSAGGEGTAEFVNRAIKAVLN